MNNSPSNGGPAASLPPLFDSTEGFVLQIPPELMPQLVDNAKAVLDNMKFGQTDPVIVTVKVDKTKNTIKPTMTFEDGNAGVFGVVILELEGPTRRP